MSLKKKDIKLKLKELSLIKTNSVEEVEKLYDENKAVFDFFVQTKNCLHLPTKKDKIDFICSSIYKFEITNSKNLKRRNQIEHIKEVPKKIKAVMGKSTTENPLSLDTGMTSTVIGSTNGIGSPQQKVVDLKEKKVDKMAMGNSNSVTTENPLSLDTGMTSTVTKSSSAIINSTILAQSPIKLNYSIDQTLESSDDEEIEQRYHNFSFINKDIEILENEINDFNKIERIMLEKVRNHTNTIVRNFISAETTQLSQLYHSISIANSFEELKDLIKITVVKNYTNFSCGPVSKDHPKSEKLTPPPGEKSVIKDLFGSWFKQSIHTLILVRRNVEIPETCIKFVTDSMSTKNFIHPWTTKKLRSLGHEKKKDLSNLWGAKNINKESVIWKSVIKSCGADIKNDALELTFNSVKFLINFKYSFNITQKNHYDIFSEWINESGNPLFTLTDALKIRESLNPLIQNNLPSQPTSCTVKAAKNVPMTTENYALQEIMKNSDLLKISQQYDNEKKK